MNWKMNPKTGQMEPQVSPAKEIAKALAPMGQIPTTWMAIETLRADAKICVNQHCYLAIKMKNEWRLLGIITNMSTIKKYLRGPLVDFYDAWLRGKPINKPEF